METDQSEPEAWQMETKGFTQLPKTEVITPLRPTPGFSNLQNTISFLEKGDYESLNFNSAGLGFRTRIQKAQILEKLKDERFKGEILEKLKGERRVAYDGVRPRNPDTLKREYVTPPSGSKVAQALFPP